jgi:hypothetical protein
MAQTIFRQFRPVLRPMCGFLGFWFGFALRLVLFPSGRPFLPSLSVNVSVQCRHVDSYPAWGSTETVDLHPAPVVLKTIPADPCTLTPPTICRCNCALENSAAICTPVPAQRPVMCDVHFRFPSHGARPAHQGIAYFKSERLQFVFLRYQCPAGGASALSTCKGIPQKGRKIITQRCAGLACCYNAMFVIFMLCLCQTTSGSCKCLIMTARNQRATSPLSPPAPLSACPGHCLHSMPGLSFGAARVDLTASSLSIKNCSGSAGRCTFSDTSASRSAGTTVPSRYSLAPGAPSATPFPQGTTGAPTWLDTSEQSSAYAASKSALTITWSTKVESSAAESSPAALARRVCTVAISSVPRPCSRFSRASRDGGLMNKKSVDAPRGDAFTCRAPCRHLSARHKSCQQVGMMGPSQTVTIQGITAASQTTAPKGPNQS